MFDLNRAMLRSRLAQKSPLGVFWMSVGSATVLELAANAKPDAIVIDAQHGLWDRQSIEHAVGAASRHAPVLIRTPENSAVAISQALDSGAEGIIVPLIETDEQAAAAVAAAVRWLIEQRNVNGWGRAGLRCAARARGSNRARLEA